VIPPTRQPQPYKRPDGLPFAPGDAWRPLRLVLDDESVSDSDVALLLSFADAEELELTRTAPGGLPWLKPQEPQEDFVPIHRVDPSGGTGLFWVWHAAKLAERARGLTEETDIDERSAWRALVLSEATEGMEADGFVTARDLLLEQRSLGGPAIYTVDEAVALVGLALRLNGNRAIGRDFLDLRLEGTTFYLVLARELLPASWRWFSGCVAHSHTVGDTTALNLGQATLGRFVRVLQIRDRVHGQAKLPQRPSVGDELVFQFETFLLFLSAAFDAAARVAHLVYLSGDYGDAGWRRPQWHSRLAAAAPTLAAVAADGAPAGAVLKLISRLRNTIHGEALRSTDFRRSGALPQSLVEVAQPEAANLLVEIELLGEKPQTWGFVVEHARTYLAVDRYTEALLPHAINALNELMAESDVGRLPGIDAQKLMAPPVDLPSPNPIGDMFNYEIRRRVRLLAGL
jgi:hypothetical protein